jgi:hypothetical protein
MLSEHTMPGFLQLHYLKMHFNQYIIALREGWMLTYNTQAFIPTSMIKMIVAIVTNAWRAFHLLSLSKKITSMSLSEIKQKVQASTLKLSKFCFDFSLALIQSADESNYVSVVTQGQAHLAILNEELGFDFDPAMLGL